MAELRRKKRGLDAVPRVVWFVLATALGLTGLVAAAMRAGWNPREPFTRKAPEVEQAIAALVAKDAEGAQRGLQDYLGTGPCTEEGSLALSDKVRKRPDGSFDLGLALFAIGEKYGAPFGEEPPPAADGKEPEVDPKRKAAIDCARIVALAVASDAEVPAELRARAAYLTGNLEFLRGAYEEAVKHYDRAIELVPGIGEKAPGDGIGRESAWNRAIALRRIEDKKKRDEEKKKQDPPDDPKEPEPKEQDPKEPEPKEQDPKEQDPKEPEQKEQDPKEPESSPPRERKKEEPDTTDEPPEAKAPPSSRMLDDLREAPSYQEENAKRDAARGRRGAAMEDK